MKRNILIVVPFLPYPSTLSGGHQAIYNGIKALAQNANVVITYESTLKDSYSEETNEMLSQSEFANVKVIPYVRKFKTFSKKEKIKRFLSRFISLTNDEMIQSLEIVNSYSNEFIEHINKIIGQENIELIQMEMTPTLPLVLGVNKNVKTIFVQHEIRYVRMQIQEELLGKNCSMMVSTGMSKILEVGLLNRYDKVITLTDIDKAKLIHDGVEPEKLYTSYAIVEEADNMDDNTNISKRLVFIGPEFHNPNVQGLKWFLDNCWSKIINKDSEFVLQIVGKWSEKTISTIEKKYPGVKFLGFINNLSDILIGATEIVPITVGSGIRMKILEAMARKVPFVSTSVGAEGIPVVDNESCFIADTPESFIESIFKLQDSNLRGVMTTEAYSVYQTTFTLKALAENKKNLLGEML